MVEGVAEREFLPLLSTQKMDNHSQECMCWGHSDASISTKLTKDKHRLAKVVATHPDAHGVVRTVTVALRDLRKSQKEARNQAKAPQTDMVVGVQRLVVLLPIEESWNNGLTSVTRQMTLLEVYALQISY